MKRIYYLLAIGLFFTSMSNLQAQDSTDVYGCMDTTAFNYNPWATIDDGSCIYTNDTTGNNFIYGCMDPAAINYNPLATFSDGSCYYDNDSTSTDIYGCTDPNALNYNFLATIDDGSCYYDNDSTGNDIYGCTDPNAMNYNFLATIDDGSCIYFNDSTDIFGCTDTSALNYNPLATIDDGSCSYFCDSTYAYFDVVDVNEEDGIITLVNNSYSNILITEYLWDFGDGATSDEQFPTHTYDTEGYYLVCLTIITEMPTFFYCTSTYCDSIGVSQMLAKSNGMTINVIPESATGIEQYEEILTDVKLYPNPAGNQITIAYNLLSNEVITTSIYDLSGRVISTSTSSENAGYHEDRIDISNISPGLYHIEIRNNNLKSVTRFQVIK